MRLSLTQASAWWLLGGLLLGAFVGGTFSFGAGVVEGEHRCTARTLANLSTPENAYVDPGTTEAPVDAVPRERHEPRRIVPSEALPCVDQVPQTPALPPMTATVPAPSSMRTSGLVVVGTDLVRVPTPEIFAASHGEVTSGVVVPGAPTPEPASLILLGTGLMTLRGRLKRRG